jgi:hypothetical protein
VPRYFTLAQAQAELPHVEESLSQAISLKVSLDETGEELRSESERIRLAGGALVHREKLVDVIRHRESIASQLRSALAGIEERGCLVKDLDTGLLDFPTRFRGEEVYLCWKRGEPAIAFWHSVSEGFKGRKPIDQDFLDNHQGDA